MKQIKYMTHRLFFPAMIIGTAVMLGLILTNAAPAQSFSQEAAESAARSSRTAGNTAPQYQIFDIGTVQTGDTASQGFGVSSGNAAVGRSLRSGGAQAFYWTPGGGIIGLPNLAGRAFCVSNGANNSGIVAGTCASTVFGSSRLPVVWENGVAAQLPLPAGETIGDANDVNSSGIAVGSTGGGSLQRAAIYSGGTVTVITQTTADGSFFITAFGVNDSGRVVGQGIDPNNAARNVGMVFDIGSSAAFEVGALPGANGALSFGVSGSGFVVGASMLNQGAGQPFIWSQAGGITAIPLPANTTQGSARAVNSAGWTVGTASSAFAVPFLYDGTATYRLADLIPAGTGWDLSTNTSSSALGISDTNIIVGTGVFNGQVRAYAMVPLAAENVSLGGRVLTAGGGGIRNALVTVSGGNLPAPVSMRTGTFGSYNFPGLQPGMNYTVSVAVSTKRYALAQATRTITLQTDVSDFDFSATESR